MSSKLLGTKQAKEDIKEGWIVKGQFTMEGLRHQLKITIGESKEYCDAYIAEVQHQFADTPYAQCAILRSVKRGDFVKRKADSNKVYRKGDYDKATKSFSLIDCDDVNHEIFVKADKSVFIGFTY